MQKRSAITIVSILAVLIVVGVVLIVSNGNESNTSVNIGVLAILSGDSAAWGEHAQRGIDLAIGEKNGRDGLNGRRIELRYEDTKGDPKQAVTAFKKLVEIEKVDAIIGPLFQIELSAVAPLIGDIPVVAPNYIPLVERSNINNPLLIWMDPPTEAERMANYVVSSGIKRASAIGSYDPWEHLVTETFIEQFTQLGGTITDSEIIPTDTTDMKTTVTKLLQNEPEAIFIGTYYQFIPIIKTLKESGFQGKLYSIEVDSYLVEETKPLSDGLQFIAPDYYSDEFVKKFEAVYGQKPGIPAGQAYDAANILLSFFEKYETKKEILQAMQEFKEYDGVSGRITINEDNHTLLPTAIFEIQKGEIVKVKKID